MNFAISGDPRRLGVEIHRGMVDAMRAQNIDALNELIETDITTGSTIIQKELRRRKV